jgi:hypothetical protein
MVRLETKCVVPHRPSRHQSSSNPSPLCWPSASSVPRSGSCSGDVDAPIETATGNQEATMGRGILLFMLGVPIPIIILLALLWH